MRAAVALVAERGTTNITISDIAEAADVSRQLVYQQFGDRDTLFMEAALDLAESELVPRITSAPVTLDPSARVLAVVEHFAEYRCFYRAMLTGPCAYGLSQTLSGLLGPFNEQLVHRMAGARLAPDVVEDLTAFVTGGWAAVINTWLIEGADPLDPEAFTDRLTGLLSVLTATRESVTREPSTAHEEERRR